MLVVTRRPDQSIEFPDIGVTVHILGVNGRAVRVGVDAPPKVKILRNELSETPARATDARKRAHDRNNRLNRVGLAVGLARRLLQHGRSLEADAKLAAALAELESIDASPAPASSPQRRCRTLIVDDDANERELLAGLLHMNGCDCSTASDGESALEALESGVRPDVVLLDMTMPRCDGPETLRRIRADERFARIRVFSVSGMEPEAVGVPVGPGGFDAWFPKPLDTEQLWEAIQRSVSSRAAAD